MPSQEFIQEMKLKLEAKREQLETELKSLSPHVELGATQDESAQEVEQDEISQDLIAAIKADLEKIEKALSKISEGTYGIGDDGREISEERLRVLPWADKAI